MKESNPIKLKQTGDVKGSLLSSLEDNGFEGD